MKKEQILWKWVEGQVDPWSEHIELHYGDAATLEHESWCPVALIGKPKNNIFPVTWIADIENPEEIPMIDAARKELDFYLLEVGGPDPWAYACYHCTTCANMYSQIHWSYFPSGSPGSRISSAVVRLLNGEGSGLFIVKKIFKGSSKKNMGGTSTSLRRRGRRRNIK